MRFEFTSAVTGDTVIVEALTEEEALLVFQEKEREEESDNLKSIVIVSLIGFASIYYLYTELVQLFGG